MFYIRFVAVVVELDIVVVHELSLLMSRLVVPSVA